jgi:hypothetical protein
MPHASKFLLAFLAASSVCAKAEVFELNFEATDLINFKNEPISGTIKGSFLLNSNPSYGLVPTQILGINLNIFGHQYNLSDVSLSPQPSVFTIGENNYGTNTISWETDDFIFDSAVEWDGSLKPSFSYTQRGISDAFEARTIKVNISAIPEPSTLQYFYIAMSILCLANITTFVNSGVRRTSPYPLV